jgi:hypothetical protein
MTDVKPFYLHELAADQAHLCPVWALADWINISKVKTGHLFCRIWSGDRVADLDKDNAMVSRLHRIFKALSLYIECLIQTSEQFLELFRNNLLDVNIDHYPYGTHSFRRGGCQYFASYHQWSLQWICDWGGWSTEFSNMTIVKYLISWNDDPLEL